MRRLKIPGKIVCLNFLPVEREKENISLGSLEEPSDEWIWSEFFWEEQAIRTGMFH